jgi:hypothetical protein
MERSGYERRFAGGLVATVGTLAAMVPPSVVLIFYANLAERSVGQMLIAGIVSGVNAASSDERGSVALGSSTVGAPRVRPGPGAVACTPPPCGTA